MKKKQLLIGGGIAVILLLLFGVWNLWFSATKVAFINYQVISLGQISKANDNSFIKISELSTDDLNRLAGYDMVFINAMGLRITEEQRAQIQKAADGGLPVLTTAAGCGSAVIASCRYQSCKQDYFIGFHPSGYIETLSV